MLCSPFHSSFPSNFLFLTSSLFINYIVNTSKLQRIIAWVFAKEEWLTIKLYNCMKPNILSVQLCFNWDWGANQFMINIPFSKNYASRISWWWFCTKLHQAIWWVLTNALFNIGNDKIPTYKYLYNCKLQFINIFNSKNPIKIPR